jgi:hypothetical protein
MPGLPNRTVALAGRDATYEPVIWPEREAENFYDGGWIGDDAEGENSIPGGSG